MVLIDGDEGEVLINPDERTIRSYQKRLEEQKRQQEHYAQLAPLPAITTDGLSLIHIFTCAKLTTFCNTYDR